MKAFAILLGAAVILTVIAGLWIDQIHHDPRMGGEYIMDLLPITLWLGGMAILAYIAITRRNARVRGPK